MQLTPVWNIAKAQFKLTKTFYRLQTRNDWYDYRSSVFKSLLEVLHQNKNNLEKDQSVIRETHSQLVSQLPQLESRAKTLRSELEKEKNRQKELESTDQEHLRELRKGIAEQNSQLEDYRRENVEVESHLERLQGKSVELECMEKESVEAITRSKKVCDEVRFYTKSEVYRLQGEHLSFSMVDEGNLFD